MLRLTVPAGSSLEDARTLHVHVAGAESNVAVALARLGVSAGWISRLVENALGRRICNEIRAHGVDISRVVWANEGRIGTYFLELGSPPRQNRIIYDRAGSAMTAIDPEEVDWGYVREARLVHLTGITPALSPACREVTVRAIEEARKAGATISFDINYRMRLWSQAEAVSTLEPLLEGIDLLFCTAEDSRMLFQLEGDVAALAEGLKRRLGVGTAVMTEGQRAAAAEKTAVIERDGYGVAPVDRIGAGDAFAAGFIYGLLTEGVTKGLEYGLALAALKHTYLGDTVWASKEDIEALIEGHSVWR